MDALTRCAHACLCSHALTQSFLGHTHTQTNTHAYLGTYLQSNFFSIQKKDIAIITTTFLAKNKIYVSLLNKVHVSRTARNQKTNCSPPSPKKLQQQQPKQNKTKTTTNNLPRICLCFLCARCFREMFSKFRQREVLVVGG